MDGQDTRETVLDRIAQWCSINLALLGLSLVMFVAFAGVLWHAQYYVRVFSQSFATASSFFGGWKVLVLPVVTAIFAMTLHWIGLIRWPAIEKIAGRPMNEVSVTAIIGCVAAALVFVLVWVFALVDAPAELLSTDLRMQQRHITKIDFEKNNALELGRIYKTQIDQLTYANSVLQNGAPILTDAQLRIAAIREQYLKHLELAPTKDTFTPELGYEWYLVAQAMEYQTISSDTGLHGMHFPKDGTYANFLETIGTYRALAMNLTEEDLRDNTPPPIR